MPHTLCTQGYDREFWECATLVTYHSSAGAPQSALVRHDVYRGEDGGLETALVLREPGPSPTDAPIQVIGREPRPASPWTEGLVGSCGAQRLEITRPMRPGETGPVVLLNGQPARGDLRLLASELGEVRAAYRLSVLCHRDGETIQLRWVRGLADPQGAVSYRAGSAVFRGGALIASDAAESDPANFWYR